LIIEILIKCLQVYVNQRKYIYISDHFHARKSLLQVYVHQKAENIFVAKFFKHETLADDKHL